MRAAAVFRWTILVLCSAACLAHAQTSSESPEAQTSYKVVGSVINSVTGEPVRRAVVRLLAGPERLAFTDAGGQFEFDNLRAGRAALLVRKPGFFDEHEAGIAAGPQIASIGPDTTPVVLKLVPEGVIYGRAQDAVGEAIEHLPVKVLTARISNGRKHWLQRQMTMTNQDGDFRVANLPPGFYYLEAGPTWRFEMPQLKNGREEAYPAIFYPAANDPAGATPLELSAGQQLNTNLILAAIPLHKISGQVVGAPADRVNFQFYDGFGESLSFPVTVSSDGHFETRAPAGSYTLEATTWGGRGTQLVDRMPLNTTSDVSGLKVVLAPAPSIPILVRAEPTHPSPASFQSRGTPSPSVHLSQAGVLLGGQEYWDSSSTDSNFHVLQNVPPGTYSVEVGTNRGDSWYVQSVQSGGVDLLRENLTIVPGAQPPAIEVVLRDDAARLTGRVALQGEDRATVIAVRDGAPLQATSVRVGGGGEFLLQNLAPGSYSILALDQADVEYSNADVLGRYLSGAVHVVLGPGEEHTINLDLIHVTE